MYSPLRFTFTFLSSVCWQPATTTQNNESGPSIHISSLYWRWHSTTTSRAASGAERPPGEEGERAQKGHSLYTIFTSNRCYISIHCTQYLHLLYTIFTFTINNIYSQEQHWGNPTGSFWVHKFIAKDILIKQYLHPIQWSLEMAAALFFFLRSIHFLQAHLDPARTHHPSHAFNVLSGFVLVAIEHLPSKSWK